MPYIYYITKILMNLTRKSFSKSAHIDPSMTTEVIKVDFIVVTYFFFMMNVVISSVNDHIISENNCRMIRPFFRPVLVF